MNPTDLFPAAVLKGLIEHGDGTAYFGSLMAYAEYRQQTIDKGWIKPTDTPGEYGQVVYCPTTLGMQHYEQSGLKDMPKMEMYSRAYMWDWSKYRP